MKKASILFVFICLRFLSHAQSGNADVLAEKIAKKMFDSLILNEHQKEQIFQINMFLHHQKAAAWKQFENQDSVLGSRLQRIENSRDSLYKRIIADENKFNLYKQKKRYLVSNN